MAKRGSGAFFMPPDMVCYREVGCPKSCAHERLDEDGICRKCGEDCRGGSTPLLHRVKRFIYQPARWAYNTYCLDCGEWYV